jgi:Iap family predicted aminopeptidase
MAAVPFGTYSQNDMIIVPGYVVHVHDAINFDIDLNFDPKQRQEFRHAIHNTYRYKEKPSFDEIKVGRVYRCRLRGIQVAAHSEIKYKQKSKILEKATNTVNRIVDRSNGWVVCIADNIDVYNRLLIDVLDPLTYESLSDILFIEYPKLFTEYVPKKTY